MVCTSPSSASLELCADVPVLVSLCGWGTSSLLDSRSLGNSDSLMDLFATALVLLDGMMMIDELDRDNQQSTE